jgi:hypothetical protein
MAPPSGYTPGQDNGSGFTGQATTGTGIQRNPNQQHGMWQNSLQGLANSRNPQGHIQQALASGNIPSWAQPYLQQAQAQMNGPSNSGGPNSPGGGAMTGGNMTPMPTGFDAGTLDPSTYTPKAPDFNSGDTGSAGFQFGGGGPNGQPQRGGMTPFNPGAMTGGNMTGSFGSQGGFSRGGMTPMPFLGQSGGNMTPDPRMQMLLNSYGNNPVSTQPYTNQLG